MGIDNKNKIAFKVLQNIMSKTISNSFNGINFANKNYIRINP